jgi:hypothetical protein
MIRQIESQVDAAPLALDGFPRPRRWRARWIWCAGDPRRQNAFARFVGEVEIADPAGCRIAITADSRYQLWVNGTPAGDGPPQSQSHHQYYDEREIGPLLRHGRNRIAVLVNHLGTIPDTRGGLLLELTDATGRPVGWSDQSWRAQACDAWRVDGYRSPGSHGYPFQEHCDLRRLERDWTEPGFDPSFWPTAEVVTGRDGTTRVPGAGPWSHLVPRDIPFLEDVPLLPTRVEQVEEALWIDNRMRSNDLTIALSVCGRPLQRARAEGFDTLIAGRGPATVACAYPVDEDDPESAYDPCVVLDFGRVVVGTPEIEVEGADGAIVDAGYVERLTDGHFVNAIECQFADRWTLAGGRRTLSPFRWRAFRYLKLRFRRTAGPLTVHAVRARESRYPFAEVGSFACEDAALSGAFRISRETIRLCSNEALMDTPWREAAQWLGDVAAVTVPGIYACYGDTALAGKFYRQSAANAHPTGMLANISNIADHHWPNAIPDYSLWWIMGLWRHYLYTGEERWVRAHYAQALRLLYAHLPHIDEHGLVADMPFWVFIDWADTDRRGECAAYNALLRGACIDLASMARLIGDSGAAAIAERVAAGIADSFHRRFFDPKRNCYADANVDGQLSPKTSEHANFAAMRFGLCDGKLAEGIAERLLFQRSPKATRAQPFFSVVVLEGLRRIGRTDLALRVIRERWGRMVAVGATSCFEEWSQDGTWRSGEFYGIYRTHSHAWSACPAEFLIAGLMGLEVLEPGCRRVRLSPWRGDIDWSARHPTPAGTITVSWKGGQLSVDAPPGVAIER